MKKVDEKLISNGCNMQVLIQAFDVSFECERIGNDQLLEIRRILFIDLSKFYDPTMTAWTTNENLFHIIEPRKL